MTPRTFGVAMLIFSHHPKLEMSVSRYLCMCIRASKSIRLRAHHFIPREDIGIMQVAKRMHDVSIVSYCIKLKVYTLADLETYLGSVNYTSIFLRGA